MKMEGEAHILKAGDVVAFPFGTGHQLGAGSGGRLILPTSGFAAQAVAGNPGAALWQ